MRPPYRGKPPYSFQVVSAIGGVPEQYDRLVWACRLSQTALLGEPYCTVCSLEIVRVLNWEVIAFSSVSGIRYRHIGCVNIDYIQGVTGHDPNRGPG